MKKHFLTVVYAIDDKPETVEAILAQRPWQAVAHTDALKDLDHAQADLTAAIDGYDAARLEVASLKKTLEAYKQSGMDFAARAHALERAADNLREENASLQQRDDDWHKEHSNALVEMAILKAAKADARHDIDDLTERDESQRLRIAELEAQLAAIGAGGVEPLRKRECLHQIIEPVQPMVWAIFAENGNCRMWTPDKSHAEATAKDISLQVTPLYAAPQPAAQAAPVDAAKLPSPANAGAAPKCLNLNDQAMWVLGWNECLDAARDAQGGV